MSDQRREEDLTAYALGELDAEARAAVEVMLAGSADARRDVDDVRATAARLKEAFASVPPQALTPAQRAAVEAEVARGARRPRRSWSTAAALAAGVAASVVALAVVFVPSTRWARPTADAEFQHNARPSSVPAPPATVVTKLKEQALARVAELERRLGERR